MAQRLGANTLEVTADQKSQLHAAAVLASNYLVTLLNASVEVGAGQGLSSTKVKEALLPLVKTSLQNASDQPLDEALSGPIKRGDITTIEKHLALLDDRPELKSLYCVLGLETVKFLKQSNQLPETELQHMQTFFKDAMSL
ncbi:MAG: DUF2520 domain-containing protein [Fodinibius sp.]|nr:DUF2520 domain-containing protein [Fodinibius sp.]